MAEVFGVFGILSAFGFVGCASSERRREAVLFLIGAGLCFVSAYLLDQPGFIS